MIPGPTNSLIDVATLSVGHHQRTDEGWLTGATVILTGTEGAVAGVDVRGGGPGTRETDALDPRNLVERVHAVVLSGGSAFGLAAADGVMHERFAAGVGLPMGPPGDVVPIVPAAVIFDLGRGGAFAQVPDADFGARASRAAVRADPGVALEMGTVGAGTGAQAGGLKGGVGSASVQLDSGITVAALVVVNAIGSPVMPDTGQLWGARHLLSGDLAGLGLPDGVALGTPDDADLLAAKNAAEAANPTSRVPRTLATTIGVVATDATLTKSQAARLAGSGHDGMARAINPIHTMYDGDTLFGLATGQGEAPSPADFHEMLMAAGEVMTRAIVRGVLAATSVTTSAGTWRGYCEAFPSALK